MSKRIASILIFFCGTLSSFYFPSAFGLRLFEFVSLFLLLFTFKSELDKNAVKLFYYFITFLIFINVSVLVAVFNQSSNLYLNQYFGVYFTILLSWLFFLSFKKELELLNQAVKYSIVIHTIFFLLQFISFYGFGNYIDFIEPITGHPQRNIGGDFSIDSGIRASGLYSEPAAYAFNIIYFNFIYLIANKKLFLFNVLSLITVMLSMSASGVVYFLIYALIYLTFYNDSKILKIRVVLLSLIAVYAFIYLDILRIDYLNNKLINISESSSFNYRIGNTINDLFSLSEFEILFGVGLGNLDIIYSKGSTYGVVLIEQGILLGSIFFFSILLLLRQLNVKSYNVLFVFILFFGTHTFSQFQFWLALISIIIFSQKTKLYEKS